MRDYINAFFITWNMFSIIPITKNFEFKDSLMSKSISLYPLVGFVLGFLLYLSSLLLNNFFTQEMSGYIVFVLWVVITGALHIDGLSDSIDGLFVPKERSLEVMKDPHVGAMGMIFTVSFLILKAISLAHIDDFIYIALVMMLARFNAVLAIYFYEYIGGGMSRGASKAILSKSVYIAAFITFFIGVFYTHFFILLFSSLLTLFVVAKIFVKKLGGFSGDVYGLSIEVSEVVLLLVFIANSNML